MANTKHRIKHTTERIGHAARKASPKLKAASKTASHHGKRIALKGGQNSIKVYRVARLHVITKPHGYMKDNWVWYAKWHKWRWHRVVHYGTLGSYLFLVGLILFSVFRVALAADLTNTWDFGTEGDYSLDSGAEFNGNSVRLKAQEYSSDLNTSFLAHMNESSGTTITDSSSNTNDGTTQNSPAWGTGQLNGGLTLDGTDQYASVPDSSSLSLGSQQTVEGWFKPSATFNSSSSSNQTIVDKGSHKVGLDRTSGKLTYEIQNNSNTSWTRQMGGDINGSWAFGHSQSTASTNDGTNYYVGLGSVTGDAEAWRFNGTTWSKLGGDGLNGSWQDQAYESVTSMAYASNTLYVGLGTGTGEGEVWSCSTSSNCTSWTKIGGDGLGLTNNTYETIQSMVVMGSTLYVGTGTTAGDGDVWRHNGGTSWTQVGGDTLNSSWASSTFEAVYSLATDGTNIYAGLGTTITDAEVWRYNGTSWTQIGGDGTNSSWNTNYELVETMRYFGGNLYAGLGSGSGDGEVWRYNGTSWTQIGGDNLNSGWTTSTWIYGMTDDGTNLYVGDQNAYGAVWRWNGTAWTKIGGTGVNSSWSAVQVDRVNGMQFFNSKLHVTASGSSNFSPVSYTWDGSTWTIIGGEYYNGSWGGNFPLKVTSSTVMNGKLYIGLYGGIGSAYVYEWDGTTATPIGGGYGMSASSAGDWPGRTYERVHAMSAYKGNLYVGLGTDSGDSDVYRWNGTVWTKVGGDLLNSSWNLPQSIESMAVHSGKLYVGTGLSGTNGGVWEYNESTWTKIGGNGLNSSWTSGTVSSLAVYNNEICIGNGTSSTIAQVWCWSGSAWTKIAGDGVNSSWSTSTATRMVSGLAVFNGELIATLADTGAVTADVWKYDGTTWTKIGGDGLNGGWQDGTYTSLNGIVVYNGSLYIATGNEANVSGGGGDVMKWDGSSWSQMAGDNLNGSWGGSIETVSTLATYNGKMFAGTGNTVNVDALVYSFGNNGYIESTTSSFSSAWRHFSVTYDGTTMKLFINGAQEASVAASASSVDNSRPLLIGRGYGSKFAGDGTDFFAGDLDEVRISNTARTSFNSTPYSDEEQAVTLASAVRKNGIKDWESLTSNETLNGGTITYRLSDDEGTTWKYWDGSDWVASSGLTQANDATVVTANMASFPVTFGGLKWQAVLKGDGTQRVTLNSVELGSNSDTTEPDTNASDILAYKADGGASISSNDWTNGSSPAFSWTAGTDADAGILGYCLYLGQTSSSDPVTTKGLLGTSPLDTGLGCQFAVSGTEINLADSGLLETPLTSSNTPYYLNIKAIDQAGNVFGTSEQFQFRFDNTAPATPGYLSAPSGFINSKEATVTWPTSGGDAASDANSGIMGLQYKIGNTAWYGDSHTGSGDINDLLANDGSYTTVDPPDFDNIEDGINTIYIRAWDAAGNYSTSNVTAVIKVNTTGSPSEPQNLEATPSTNTTNSFAFDWDPPATYNTTTGQPDKLTYCYVVNTLPNVSNCNFTDEGDTELPTGAYATQPGSNTLYVVAKDDFGAISYSSYASVTFTANTSAPGIPSNIDVADVSVKTTSNWRLAVTWDEPSDVGAGVDAYRIFRSTDNSSFSQVGTSTSTSFVDSGLSQVTYYYKVKACDSANNCGAFTSTVSDIPTGKYTVAADMTSPPVVSGVTTKRASIAWSTDRASDSKIVIGTASGDYSPSEIGNSSQVTAHNIDLDNLAAGTTYYFLARWTDVDGNTGNSQEYSFTTAPAPLLKEVDNITIGLSTATIQFTIKDSAKVDLQYGKSDSFGGVKSINTSLSESTYEMELTGLDDGTKYFYRIIMHDTEGGTYQSSIFSLTTPPRPKISNLRFQPVSGEPTSTQEVTWTTNIPTTSAVAYGKVGTNGTTTQTATQKTSHKIVIRGLEDDSEYFLIAQGRDGSGNLAVSDRQIFKTALDTRPPEVSDIVIEPTIRGTGAEARGQIVVSWTTDEPSTSQVAFGEGSAVTVFNNRTAEDAQLTTEHLVIISDLPTSKVYSIMPVSRDKSGNDSEAVSQAAIIGRASDSVLNIVLNTLRKVFGL